MRCRSGIMYFFTISVIFCQEIPNEFFDYKYNKLLFDIGKNWQNNTFFTPIREYNIFSKEKIEALDADFLYLDYKFGLYHLENTSVIYSHAVFKYKKYLYGYLYPRITNNNDNLKRYTGIPRNISRGGFNSGETDLSGIGFQNSWLSFQVGRGREIWGAGNDIQLAISETSPSYDYFMLGSNYGNFRVKYFHGFLESDQFEINRYITGKGLEWTNRKSTLLGLSEIIIYSGEHRSLDFAYLNPISSHLEIELNNRLNTIGTTNSNAVWQLFFDKYLYGKLRFSLNILYDEFVLDKSQLDSGKEHGKANSQKIVFNIINKEDKILNIYMSRIYVGTPTFRHINGANNFVQRGLPLGWKEGSDGESKELGIEFCGIKTLIFKISCGQLKLGQESVKYDSYQKFKDYLKGPFPSGVVDINTYIKIDSQWWIKRNFSMITLISIDKNGINFKVGFNSFLGGNYKL